MARVLALVPDGPFGRKVVEALGVAGHEVELVSSEPEVWDLIAGSEVLVVDLAARDVDGVTLVDTLRTGGEMGGTRAVGLSADDAEVRERALDAGFEAVVDRDPRAVVARVGAG